MNNFEVTAELIVPAYMYAEGIEAQLGLYLPPPARGAYTALSSEPVLKPDHWYYQRVSVNGKIQEINVSSLEEVKGDVYDIDAVLVVPRKLAKTLSWEPSFPSRGMKIVSAAVDWTISEGSRWAKRPRISLHSVLQEHLREEYQQDELALCRLSELVFDVCDQVRQFIGKDHWVMHFHKQRGRDIVVEKTVDWRIVDWERRMASGEWT